MSTSCTLAQREMLLGALNAALTEGHMSASFLLHLSPQVVMMQEVQVIRRILCARRKTDGVDGILQLRISGQIQAAILNDGLYFEEIGRLTKHFFSFVLVGGVVTGRDEQWNGHCDW